MRTLTVETKWFIFPKKLYLAFAFFILLFWFSWVPVQQYFVFRNEVANTNGVRTAYVNEGNDEMLMMQDQMIERPYVVIDCKKMMVAFFTATDTVEYFEINMLPSTSLTESVSEGTYRVDKKVTTELSTVTMTRFPYYISFGDGYALHGVPTNAEGDVLPEKYVGGMVELKTEDAKKIFDLVAVGTHVTVINTGSQVTSGERLVVSATTTLTDSDALPATTAHAYAVVDISNGQIFLDKNETNIYPIASITKLVTAAVASDVIGQGTEMQAPNGEYYTVGDLYYPLLLKSDNEVAQLMAEQAGSHYFLSNMNAYVEVLSMKNTSFSDASGLSPKNISSAQDLVRLAQHLYDEKKFLLDITNEESMTITSTKGVSWNIKNQNKLVSDPHFRGGKLGYTDEAGQTSLAIFTVPIYGEVRPIAVVILHSKDWKQDTRALLKWLVENTKKSTS
jgi:D-alanyl-D-alanine endopeptidase (penicillin-binding protein 7)